MQIFGKMGMDFEKVIRAREKPDSLLHREDKLKLEQWMKPWRESIDREKNVAKNRSLDSTNTAIQMEEKRKLIKRPNGTRRAHL